MKALVTGATGFIGSHVADLLKSLNFEVRCIYRPTSNLRWLENKNFELVLGSLSDKNSLKSAVDGVDYIFHVGGLTAAKNLDEFMRGNRDGTRNLLEAVKEVNPNIKRFLHTSSLTVTGPAKSLSEPVSEETICNPITSYGKSKLAAEEAVKEFFNDFPITIIRPPAVYGPRDEASFALFQTAKSHIGTLIGFNTKYVSIIHSTDLARGIVEAALSDNTINKTYFVSSEKYYNWDELTRIMGDSVGKKKYFNLHIPHWVVFTAAGISEFIGKLRGKPPVFNYEKGLDFVQDYWICSVETAKRDFNYSQKVSIKDGMFETARWYKENGWF